jgi:hypothetical protein
MSSQRTSNFASHLRELPVAIILFAAFGVSLILTTAISWTRRTGEPRR